jgi:hypothetical protein
MATSAGATRAADQITFAHNSERQFARLLDFYRVEWEYEPTAFPIEWDANGQPAQLFRPDFYLPGFRLYIEITTLNQRLVTKKNRKVRRLRELYPDVRIKVLYQRDYLSLLAKYGLEPPSQMLDPTGGSSGSTARDQQPGGRGRGPEAMTTGAVGPSGPVGGAPPDARASRPSPGPVAPAGQGGAALAAPVKGARATGRVSEGLGGVEGARATGRVLEGSAGAVEGARAAGRVSDGVGGAVERARAAGRPRVLPDPPLPAPPLPADPELVRLAQVLLPAEEAQRRGPAAAERAG